MVDGDSRLHSARPRLEWLSDIVVACGLIALFLPLMIIVATAIKCGSPGPVFCCANAVQDKLNTPSATVARESMLDRFANMLDRSASMLERPASM